MNDFIEIKGARVHNLKNIDVKIPKNKLTVITGVSGSGKSSLAFDTLYEEGKRRYLLFSGTQFMIDSVPNFDRMTGLSPTVAVEQRIIRQSNPRSTVGTRTKISSMLAVLFAAYGERTSEYDDGLPLAMEMFQKNSPKGMCVKCLGSGVVKKLDEDKLFGNTSLKIEDVCLGVGKRGTTKRLLDSFCKYHGVQPQQTLAELTIEQLNALKYGDGGRSSFMGFIPWITNVANGAFSSESRLEFLLTEAGFMYKIKCPKCNGEGIGQQAMHTTIAGYTIADLEKMYIKELHDILAQISDSSKSYDLIKEILIKLECMIDVGLHHLSLSRPVPSLSGGEIQRLFLASYIIAQMDSIIFVFDEPTIGLHEVEKQKLIDIIRNLVNRGNTVVAVEHDENFMRNADYIIDLGPDAGVYGGERIYQGSFQEFLEVKNSKTAPYLAHKSSFKVKQAYKPIDTGRLLTLENGNIHNLRNVTIDIPLGLMVGVAGVSGSGKSSLIADTLVPKLKEALKTKCIINDGNSRKKSITAETKASSDFGFAETDEADYLYDDHTWPGNNNLGDVQLKGVENITKCLVIDQKPIGRSRTSCPATYVGIFDRIRNLFANTPEALEYGYSAGMFSLNSEGGCKVCKGEGVVGFHVGFGNFITIECEACGGMGFVAEAMEITIDGKTIRDVLQLSVDEAAEFFKDRDNNIENILKTMQRVGMGYIKLGQKTPTISGGESQRIKLAKELSKGQISKNALYILDEPTTGLAFADSEKLMLLLQELVDRGNTVIVTEHDPYVLSNCDYLIEMGVGGGSDGGNVIAKGTPRELKMLKDSIIGRYLV